MHTFIFFAFLFFTLPILFLFIGAALNKDGVVIDYVPARFSNPVWMPSWSQKIKSKRYGLS